MKLFEAKQLSLISLPNYKFTQRASYLGITEKKIEQIKPNESLKLRSLSSLGAQETSVMGSNLGTV